MGRWWLGGYSNVRSVAGDMVVVQGITTFYSDTTYYLQVGEGGVNVGRGGFPGGGQGGGGHIRGRRWRWIHWSFLQQCKFSATLQ